jgi:hypothetical protein
MERIIIRPMYSTDADFKKGMKIAILESTGKEIKRHYDNVAQFIPLEYKTIPCVSLTYDEIDWKLAGYKTK